MLRAAFRALRLPVILLAPLVSLSGLNLQAGEPLLEKVDVFKARSGGYHHVRVPGIIVTPRGSLLCYGEARKTSGDWANIDLVLRRSIDGGNTWQPMQILADGSAWNGVDNEAGRERGEEVVTCNNVVMIPDRETGAVHGLYCIEYARCYSIRSDDDGVTFSDPVDITATLEPLRDIYPWTVLATGPGHGVQLESGRLLVPVWLSLGTGRGGHRPSCITTIYSDDHGESWHAGDVIAIDHPEVVNPSETVAVQLADGRVMLNIRNEGDAHRRAVTTSPDGDGPWTELEFDEALYEPVCMGSICRLTQKPGSDKNRILYSHPDSEEISGEARARGGRQNLTIKLSEDDGKTWTAERVLEPGVSGYSDLAVSPEGMICCVYERGSATPGENDAFDPAAITVARFNLAWLMANE